MVEKNKTRFVILTGQPDNHSPENPFYALGGITDVPGCLVEMSGNRGKMEWTPGFWTAGLVLLCVVSALVVHWPHLSGRVDKILDSFYYILIGIFLPFLG